MTSNNFWRIRPFVARIKREYGGMHPSDVIGMLRYNGLRWVDIAKKLNCSQATISAYIREEDKGFHNITAAGREVKRQNAIKLNQRMEAGEVQRGGFAKIPLDMVARANSYDTASRL